MAYGLKYKASKTHENGDKYEVRIYRDGWTGASYGIGNLTRLSLSIQGDTAALTAPIIKTSLNIGMIDTPDKGGTKPDGTTCVDANGDKVGKWEEFYTNNPTLYKVELRYTGALTRNAVIWTGFLTPDSWGEDMTYGGTISLVARDMLGTLSEYEFDLTGDVTITQIVQGALTKCKCAMTATMRTSECLQNAGNSQSILNAKINASTFAGKSWYEALEQTLEGVGLILRYDGNNGFDCTSIRYAASHAVEGGENAHTPAFYNRSGYRTLDPAVKQIVEVFNPSIESIAPVEPGADDWTDTGQTLTQKFKNHLGQESTYSYPKMSLSAQGVDYSGTGALPYYENTYIYNGTTGELIPTFRAPLYIPINLQSSADFLTLKNAAFVPPFNLSFSNPMGSTGYLLFTPAEGSSPRVLTNTYSRDFEQKVRFRITCKKNGTTYYWDTSGAGAWGTTEKVLEYVTGERIQVAELEGATDYAIGVNTVVVPAPASATDFYPARAAFIPLVFEVAPIDGNDVCGEYKTTTIYDEENHIEINRTPSIGAINSSTPAAFLPNVLHYGTTPASDKWRWAGENSAGLPLAVVIHQQLLVFNCAQNGNSIFTGDLLDLTSRVSVPGTNYDYFTRSCALLAGDYNCLSGYIEGVTLREIYDWDDVWDGVTPEYTEKESQAKGGTAASGGGGSSSGGGGGSSHTHPNKEVLDGITAEKVTSWDGAASVAHTHANKTILDAIQEASITHWDAAYAHSQIGVAATTPSGNPHNTTLAQIVGNADLAAKIIAMTSWFGKDENGVYVEKENGQAVNFFSYGEVTAGGVGSGGGGGTGALYTCADVTAYNNSKVGRSTTEGAQVGDLLAYDGTHWHAVVAPATGVTKLINRTGEISQAQLRSDLGLGNLAYLNGLSKADVGLGNVDNTADANKSVASAVTCEHFVFRYGGTSIDLNTVLNGGGLVSNYGSYLYWVNAPSGMGYGSAIQFQGAESLSLQLAWDINHNSANSTNRLWFRSQNNLGWQNDWKEIYHSGNLTAATLGLGNVENKSSATIRSEIVASNIPALDASKITTGQFADARISSASAWNSKWDYNENTIKAVKVNNAGNADTLENHSASYFATASSLGNYLPLSGGTISSYNVGPLIINSTNAYQTEIQIQRKGVVKASFGSYDTWEGAFMFDTSTGYAISVSDKPYFRGAGNYEIYHSGNCNNTSTPWSCSNLTASGDVNVGGRISGVHYIFDYSTETIDGDGYWIGGAKHGLGSVYSGLLLFSNTSKPMYMYTGGTCRIYIDGITGNVGIGTTSPSEKLHVAGNIVATGDVAAGSDARWKHNITPVLNGIDAIMRLQPSEWEWNSDNHKGSGLVAQQTREVLPHLVKEDSEGYLHLTYDGLHAYEISAIQHHENEIDRLRKRVAYLENKLQQLNS